MANHVRLSSPPTGPVTEQERPNRRQPAGVASLTTHRFLTLVTERASQGGGNTEPLAAELQRHLAPLLALSAGLAETDSAELYVLLAGRWRLLSRHGAGSTPARRLEEGVGRAPEGEADGGVSWLRGHGSPPLALALAAPPRPAARKQLQQALAVASLLVEAWVERQRASEARRWLVTLRTEVAHELRTPLTAVSGFAQLLQRPGTLDERRRRNYAGIAVTESRQATVVVDRILAQLQAEVDDLEAAGAE